MQLISDCENQKVELVCASNDPHLYFGYTNDMAVRREAMARCGPFLVRARGSDTIFVRAVVDALSCEAVAYCPEMSVRHAELESIGGLLYWAGEILAHAGVPAIRRVRV
jgi:hypothetical protein